jgi:hypothetical protein
MEGYISDEHLHDLDRWIEKLNNCKPLTENEVKSLCEMVIYICSVGSRNYRLC